MAEYIEEPGGVWFPACGCELVPGVHDPAGHPAAEAWAPSELRDADGIPLAGRTRIRNVPLVTYRAGGERVEIGSAEVRPDGTVAARVEAPEFAGLLDTALDGFSFGLGAPPVDVLAKLRAENRRLRGEVKRLSDVLADQMTQAAAMRRDVAELARQAGVLLEAQTLWPEGRVGS